MGGWVEVAAGRGAPGAPEEGLVAASAEIEGVQFSLVWQNETDPAYGPVLENGRGYYHDQAGTRLNREEVLQILSGAA